MALSTTIITSKYGLRRVKTLPSNMAVAFIEETYEEGFGPISLVNNKGKEAGIIRFETKKSQYPSGKYLNYVMVKERITPVQGVRIKGLIDAKKLMEIDSLSYALSKGKSISGDENSFSGSVVFGKPAYTEENKKNLSSIEPRKGKGITLLEEIFKNVKSEINFSEDEAFSFSSSEDQVTESGNLEIKQYKYSTLKSLATGESVSSSGNFYTFSTETSSFDGNGNIIGSIVKTYKPKKITATSTELKGLLEQDMKLESPPTKIFLLLKELSYSYKTQEKFYNKPLSKQYNMDAASLNATSTITFTNASNISSQGYVSNVTEEVIDQEIPKGKKLIVKGSLTGFANNVFSVINNDKFKKALQGLNDILQKYKITLSDLNKPAETKILNMGTYQPVLINADVNFGVSNGTINFSFTAEERADLAVDEKDFLYLNVSWLEPQPVHWANSFLILGGEGGVGEELMQDSKQSRPLEYVLKVNGIMREYDRHLEGFKKFKQIVIKNKKKILKSASFNYNYAAKSIEGTAVFIEFDKNREMKDGELLTKDSKKPQ